MTNRIMQANEAKKTMTLRFLRLPDYSAFADEFTQNVHDGLHSETDIVAFTTEWERRI